MVTEAHPLTSLWRDIETAGPRVVDRYPSFASCDETVEEMGRMDAFRRIYAYAVPTEQVLATALIFARGPVVEIGAGRGLWAHLMQEMGGVVRPTDAETPETNGYVPLRGGTTWTYVEQMDAVTAATEATEPTLLTIWPSYDRSWAHWALKAFRGERIIYVGEGNGGCTADDAFHAELAAHWILSEEVPIPQWCGASTTR